MVEGNVFIYYGVPISKGEAFDIAQDNSETDIYNVCMMNDLKCQYVGQTSYSSDMIVGREVFWNYGHGYMKLDLGEHTNISTLDVDNESNIGAFPITKSEEEEVENILKKIGIGGKPGYYVISSFFVE